MSVATSSSATFTFTSETGPNRASTASTSSGATAGTVALTGTVSRTGSGQPCQPASMVADNQRADSAGPYSGNGENSAHPTGPLMSMTSRSVVLRKVVFIGSPTATALSASSSRATSAFSDRICELSTMSLV